MQLIGKKKSSVYDFWQFWLDCLFPKQCFVCQNEGEYLCSACFDKVKLAKNQCYLCHKETDALGLCVACQAETKIDELVVAASYRESVSGLLVESLKYNYVEAVAEDLISLFIKRLKRDGLEDIFQKQIFIPIPLHKKRLVERGFNQAELLAKYLACYFNGHVDVSCLKRQRQTAQQAKLTRQGRLDNMKMAFTTADEKIYPNVVVLVDDVVTTGSTLSEAAKILKANGVKKIIAVAMCHG